ncbi:MULTISPECIES: DUF3048 domain-containing protein [Paenibacillus]|jgi:hypothetical protein|uniref:DUF3048 domain-containing protein n=1 Tax=Paenibacillus TaxID=44249 RepID=UPI000561947F|nr:MULTISPECIES: DUF3048 domain-containing protein [Paenibacillus]ANA81016.1 hypothetical protein A3958_13995 [Paenibacillus glucanolyticus]
MLSKGSLSFKRFAWRTSLLSIAAVLLLSACNGDKKAEPAPTPEVEAPMEQPAEETQENTSSPYHAPLTGLPLEASLTQRPLAVMINNAPAARPQSGLGQADMVYEVLAEGGITRLIGIFQSQSGIEEIGPIRSIRPYLINLGESYGGVLVHAGGSPEAYTIIQQQRKQDMDEIGNAGAYFWRANNRKAPHNLYSSDEKLREGAAKLNYGNDVQVPQYTFYPETIATSGDGAEGTEPVEGVSGEPAEKVEIKFLLDSYVVDYQYDGSSNTYKRSVNGSPHVDLNDNVQLEAANVIVLGADHKVLDDVGRLAVNVEAGGEAMLFQRGEVITGQWARAAGDAIRFVKDGKEVPLVPGTTYFNIVPNAPSFESHVTISNP